MLRRWLRRLTETDEERLAAETRDWAATVPGTRRISESPNRERVRVAAAVRRISLIPSDGYDTLESVVSDGTGELVARWTGRQGIPGLSLGTRMVLEGVIGEERDGRRRMVNPRFEFVQ